MEGMEGRSFLPVLKGQSQVGRDQVFTHMNTLASKRRYIMRSVQDRYYGYIWNGWADGRTLLKNESKTGYTYRAMFEAAASDPTIAARVKHLDYRVPETQGFATFTALQRRGIPSRLLYFPDENHWVLKPQNSIQWHQEVEAWLDRWLK